MYSSFTLYHDRLKCETRVTVVSILSRISIEKLNKIFFHLPELFQKGNKNEISDQAIYEMFVLGVEII